MDELSRGLRTARSILVVLTILSIGTMIGLVLSAGIDAPPSTTASTAPPVVLGGAISKSPFVAVARTVVPAVVYVDTKRKMRHPPVEGIPPQSELFRFFGPGDERPEMNVPSSGSGFIIDEMGHVMTNNHVVERAESITVHLSDGRTFGAELVGSDAMTDVAVLRIRGETGRPAEGLPNVILGNSDLVEVGEWAMAIGNPLGQLEGSVTVGVVSAKGRSDLQIAGGGPDYQDFIQTDASINFGNSGGPLVNAQGEVIGMTTAINPTGQGLGFAIPINMARDVSDQLISSGKVSRSYMGIVPQELTEDLAEGLGCEARGILVAGVEADGPADRAGIRVKDVITSLNGVPTAEVNRFRRMVADVRVGSDVSLVLVRDGRELRITMRFVPRPEGEDAAPEPVQPVDRALEWEGMRIEPMDRKLAEELDVPYAPCLLVTGVRFGSPAAEAGFEEGDQILDVGDVAVQSLGDWKTAMGRAELTSRPIVMRIRRYGQTLFLALRPSEP